MDFQVKLDFEFKNYTINYSVTLTTSLEEDSPARWQLPILVHNQAISSDPDPWNHKAKF